MDSSPQTVLVRDESFYFEDDPMATFLVENRLFKVHRHYFIQGSIIFRDMFAQTGGQDDTTAVEKTPDEESIPLPGVTVKEFQMLLHFFYAMTSLKWSSMDTLIVLLAFDLDEKLALLSIAHRFVFDNIFKYISRQIQPKEIPVVDRIRFGDTYHLTDWLSSAYEEILDRDSLKTSNNMSEEEVDVLGVDRVIKILEAKNFMLGESLKHIQRMQRGVEEQQKLHKNRCMQCRNCNYWMYNGGSGTLPSHLDGLTPAATVVQRLFFPPSHPDPPIILGPSLLRVDDGADV